LVPVDQRLDAADAGERRQHGHVHLGVVLLRQRESDLLHQGDRLEMGAVHLRVAGDQRFAAHERSRTSIPGSVLPSRNSSDAPPPVEMCEKDSSARPSWRTAAAEPPPPTTENASDFPIASATPRVPAANGAISNTPIGPFQNTVRASASTWPNAATVCGPTSRPSQDSGIESAATVCVLASAANLSATTTSCGRTSLSPASASSRLQVSIMSSSSSEPPTAWPWAARNVKHMPPPTSSLSTLGSSASITASLSETFEPPSTTTYG